MAKLTLSEKSALSKEIREQVRKEMADLLIASKLALKWFETPMGTNPGLVTPIVTKLRKTIERVEQFENLPEIPDGSQ